jgi:hypothetical protein
MRADIDAGRLIPAWVDAALTEMGCAVADAGSSRG